MLKKSILIGIITTMSLGLYSQMPAMDLAFTAIDSLSWIRLDSIEIINRTQGGDTVLYYPDTVLTVYYVGIPDIPNKTDDFRVLLNYPNPLADRTNVSLFIPEPDNVSIIISDMSGRIILKSEWFLGAGNHSFLFTPGEGPLYLFSASWKGISRSIKLICISPNSSGTESLEYTGSGPASSPLKASGIIQDFPFSPDDELLYIGYADTLESGMPDAPEESQTYTFQFAANIPCPGTPAVDYEGQVYHTIQVFSQCWLKENLNVGLMIYGTANAADNDTIEKYCYYDKPDSCNRYGGLYQWDEMMQYTIQPGNRGICPPGWHIPADEEWKVLEGAADNYFRIGDPEWDKVWAYRGGDAGENLKASIGWYGYGSGSDSYGLSCLPGGNRDHSSNFYRVLTDGFWWTSTTNDTTAWFRDLEYNHREINRGHYNKQDGFSVRCLRDY